MLQIGKGDRSPVESCTEFKVLLVLAKSQG